MAKNEKINIFWFRRDLRFFDNTALLNALKKDIPVLPLFIFDTDILDGLNNKKDARITFIHDTLSELHQQLKSKESGILVKTGVPANVFKDLINNFNIGAVYTNHDYEPYARQRDKQIKELLLINGIEFHTFKDQVIFEKNEILTNNQDPYKVYTPYKNKWLLNLKSLKEDRLENALVINNFIKDFDQPFPSLKEVGFERSHQKIPSKHFNEPLIQNYDTTRDIPALEGTSRLGIHLRFGTISIRELVKKVTGLNQVFLSELIWREFYMMILFHFPHVVTNSFKPNYDKIQWINNDEAFKKWCNGQTGYPIVDAGMRQLNSIGFMHNRARMIVASFLCKHLLIDWRWGEAYFAEKLLDYELASNNGGWQWAAGTGTDAQPYFRIFNPYAQAKKFDPELKYIKQWVPEFGTTGYPKEIINHQFARERAIKVYKKAIQI